MTAFRSDSGFCFSAPERRRAGSDRDRALPCGLPHGFGQQPPRGGADVPSGPVTAADGDVAVLAADLDHLARAHGLAVAVELEDHRRLAPAMAELLDLLE